MVLRLSSEGGDSLFNPDLLVLDLKAVAEAVKGEVGLVQGRRRRSKHGNEDAENPDGEGAGDSGTKVTQMSLQVFKKTLVPPENTGCEAERCRNRKTKELRIDLERLFVGFCVEHKIPLQFLDGEEEFAFSRRSGGQQEGGQGGKPKSSGVGGGSGGESKRVEKSFSSNPSSGAGGSGAAGGGAGAGGSGGGDKQPPRPSRSESSLKGATSEAEITSDASTTSIGGEHVLPGKRKKKRATFHDETHQQVKKPHLTVTDTDDPGGRLMVSSFSILGRKQKKSTVDRDVGKHQKPHPGGSPVSITKPKQKSKSIMSKLKPVGLSIRRKLSSLKTSKLSQRSESLVSFNLSPSSQSSSNSISQNPGSEELPPLLVTPLLVPPPKVRVVKRKSGKKHNHSSAVGGADTRPLSRGGDDIFIIAAERGSEWLHQSSSDEDSLDEDGKEKEDYLKQMRDDEKLEEKQKDEIPQEDDQFEIQPELKLFMESTRVLDKVHSIMGLFPYQKIVGKNKSVEVKWVPRSMEYIGVCVNAFIFVIITLSGAFSLGIISEYSDNLSTTQRIVQSEFVNHIPDSLFLILFSILLSVWSVSCVMELGIHYAEFYTRFNLGICLLKYDVTSGLHQMIVGVFAAVAIFNLFITALFFAGRNTVAIQNGMGFIGFIILRPYNFTLRESIYYPLVQIFGLLVFLYFFLCLNVLLLQLAVYGKAVGNMGSQFNLRLAYTLGKLGRWSYGQDGKENVVKKIIPFEKLYAEHLVIVSLFRMLSQVNRMVFRTFLFCIIAEIILCIWLLFDLFLDSGHSNMEIFLENVGFDIQLPVRVRANELLSEAIVKGFFILVITMCGYFLFTGVMHNAAEKLHISNDYIRRYGLTTCRSLKERRFILSMINSFTSKSAYWIGKIFHLSRPFLLRLTSFIFVISMVVVSYHPERLAFSLIEHCTQQGQCLSIRLFSFQTYLFYAANDNSVPPTNPKPPTLIIKPPPFNESNPEMREFLPPNIFLENPPCVSYSTHSLSTTLIAKNCPANWTLVKTIKIPFIYKPMVYTQSNAVSRFFGRIHQPFISFPTSFHTRPSVAECPGPDEPFYNFPFRREFGYRAVSEMVDCFGQYVSAKASDDCGNPRFFTPTSFTSLEKREAPILRLIAMNQLPEFGKDDDRFFCCYQFALSSPNEVKVCNMPDPETLLQRCWLHASGDFSRVDFVNDLKKERNKRDMLASTVPFDDEERLRWTKCLCNKEVKECEKLKPPRNGTTTSTTTSTTPKSPPAFGPPCLSKPTIPVNERLFTKCEVQDKTGKWADIDVILYPNILKKQLGAYRQHVPMDMLNCEVNGTLQFPTTSSPVLPSPPIHDCLEREYTEMYEDDCRTPIFRWPTFYRFDTHVRAVPFYDGIDLEIKCCVDLGFLSKGHRKQALVCNMPSETVFESNCKTSYNPNVAQLANVYRDAWSAKNETEQDKLEREAFTLKCLCYHLKYVKKLYPNLDIPVGTSVVQYCRDHFIHERG